MNYWDEEKTSQMNVGEITAFGMTTDTPEPVTADVEDLRQFLGGCTRRLRYGQGRNSLPAPARTTQSPADLSDSTVSVEKPRRKPYPASGRMSARLPVAGRARER